LADVKKLAHLQELYLHETAVTDAGLHHLQDMGQLRKLVLSYTPISDVGLANLSVLSELHTLNLAGTKVTDKGLLHLKEFVKLRALHVRGLRITPKGADKLRKYLPELVVIRDGSPGLRIPLLPIGTTMRATPTTLVPDLQHASTPKLPAKPMPTGSSPPKEHLQR
jgi:hypothetical protein